MPKPRQLCYTHEVLVYHDETHDVQRRSFKGHALLFVPTRLTALCPTGLFPAQPVEYFPLNVLYDEIEERRAAFNLSRKLHFTEISGKTWTQADAGTRTVVDLAVDALRSRRAHSFPQPLCCKLAVMFYPRQADLSLYGTHNKKEQHLQHTETVLRMLLKGALHYLYDDQNQVAVQGLISDGRPAHRPLDDQRAMWRIAWDEMYGRTPARPFVTLASGAQIIHLNSDHKCHAQHSLEHTHANMLQLVDLLLGSVIRSCCSGLQSIHPAPRIGAGIESKKDAIACPVKQMLDKTARGTGFKNSGHYKSFTIGRVSFDPKGVTFQRLSPKEIRTSPDALQLTFPDQKEPATESKHRETA